MNTFRLRERARWATWERLTKGNEAMLNGQIDLNIAGGTNSILPFACTTMLVLMVPSKLSSALKDEWRTLRPFDRWCLPIVEQNIRRPNTCAGNANGLNVPIVLGSPFQTVIVPFLCVEIRGVSLVAAIAKNRIRTRTSHPLMTRISFFSSWWKQCSIRNQTIWRVFTYKINDLLQCKVHVHGQGMRVIVHRTFQRVVIILLE